MKLRKRKEAIAIAIVIAIASSTGLLITASDGGDAGRHVRYAGVVDEGPGSAERIVAEVTGDGRTVVGVPCAADTATGAGSEDTVDWCLRPLVETFHDDVEHGGPGIEPGP